MGSKTCFLAESIENSLAYVGTIRHLKRILENYYSFGIVSGLFTERNLKSRLFLQEAARQEDASIILLFEDVNYKVNSTSKLLLIS